MDFRSIVSFVNSPGISDGQPGSPVTLDRVSPFQEPEMTSYKVSGKPSCEGCGNVIHDRWLLEVGADIFHMSCLRCCMCLRTLDNQTSCFIRDQLVYCRFHYQSKFRSRCAGCNEVLQPSDWIRKARDLNYHLDCFCCQICKRKLSTGDTCAVRADYVLCSEHFDNNSAQDDDAASVSSIDSDCRASSEPEERPGKRARTSFTQAQIKVLQDWFRRNPNPSPDDIENISELTGHPRKTIMVWFQNARARNKKLLLGSCLSNNNQPKTSAPRTKVHIIVVDGIARGVPNASQPLTQWSPLSRNSMT